jgi:hypothetical protein
MSSGTSSGLPISVICCSRPSSTRWKSLTCNPRNGSPFASTTDTGTITRFELTRMTSKSSSLGGAGVGVGLGVGAGGGGGRSRMVWADVDHEQKKKTSTASSSAGRKCFPTRSLIITPFPMPPALLALLCFLNNFSDGMIHGIRCDAAFNGCTRTRFTRRRVLVLLTSTRAGSSHRRRRRCEALVYQ